MNDEKQPEEYSHISFNCSKCCVEYKMPIQDSTMFKIEKIFCETCGDFQTVENVKTKYFYSGKELKVYQKLRHKYFLI